MICIYFSLQFVFFFTDALLQMAYESNIDQSPTAAMWMYRTQITTEHLGFFIEQQTQSVEFPVLKEFLKEVIL